MTSSVGWIVENDELIYKSPLMRVESSTTNNGFECKSNLNGDAGDSEDANFGNLSAFEGTGISIKRQISSSNLGDFRIFLGGALANSNSGFGSTMNNALVIKDASKSNYAYYHSQATKNLALFTGSHISKIDSSDNELLTLSGDLIGRCVSMTGEYSTLDLENDQILENKYEGVMINNAHPVVKFSTLENDKKIYGIISEFETNSNSRTIGTGGIFLKSYAKNSNDVRVVLNSIGEGGIWVVNSNGSIQTGDYVSSFKEGYCQKQDNDSLHNYTVAKITCDCNFDETTDWNDENGSDTSKFRGKNITIDGITYKAAFLGCIYLCG